MPDPGRFSQFLGIGKEAERHERGEDPHQHDGDRIVVTRVGVVLYPLQAALQSRQLIERARQHEQYVFADEAFPI